jgi:PAS domain S-box-containing protein
MSTLQSIKILLLEDSPSDARLVQGALAGASGENFEVTWIDRLDTAIEKLLEIPFDIGLIDLGLPDSMGKHTYLSVMKAAPTLPLIVLTGFADETLGAEAIRDGVEDYLVKGSVDGKAMVRSIRYAIERKQSKEASEKLQKELEKHAGELEAANISLRESRRAALNLIEDADKARKEAQGISAELERDVVERKKTERELVSSREEWVETFNVIPDLIAILDDKHRIVRVNKAMADGLGISQEQAPGLPCYKCVHNAKEPTKTCPHSLMLNDRKQHIAEIHEDALGGDFLVSVTPIFDETGQLKGGVHVARDITERKKKEEDLQKLNQTLKAHNKSSQAMMRALDEDKYLKEVCRIITEDCGHMMVWIGYAENDDGKSVKPVASAGFEEGYLERLGITWADNERGRGPTGTAIRTGKPSGCRNMLTDPAFKPWREEAMKRGYASSLVLPLLTGKKAFGAMTIYSKEPDSFTADETALLTDLSDDLAYGILTIRLQKARALAEETVRKERNFSNAVIQTTSGLIIGMDPEGRIQLFNHACEKITGYTFNELKGKPFWDYLLLPEEMDAVKEVFKGIKDGKITAESEFENYWKTKGGSRRFIRWANSALKDASGNVELIIGTGIDMTDDKENRARIDELNSFLMQKTTDLLYANKELETFSYSVSHDLRSPLRAIKGFSTILLKDYSNNLDADGQDFLNRIKGGADRMSDLIDDMLSLAKISRDEMDPKEIDLSDVVESIVSELRQAEKDRNVEAIITKGLKAHCDARLMHIALSNLIGNAWKYSSKTPNAVIEFGAMEKNGENIFFVRDNGAGFDMAHAKKLFTPFQRLHSDSHFTGTGIGLAIVNKVILRHGGRIWGEGETGKGATFYFTLKDVNP